MNFIIATNNQKKKKEISEILSQMNIEAKSLKEAGIEIEIEETGTTFEENALIKAKAICELTGIPSVADDSGLCVDALNGEPGVYSARYGGEKYKSDTEKYLLLLKNMEKFDNRKARFVCCVACAFPDGRNFIVRGECEGEILYNPSGSNGFGYDPVFFLKEYNKTMAELDPELKNKISHRATALEKFNEELKKYI